MGLSTINDPKRYGLSLVLGGGEVTLLELTNAYGVFANNGIYHKQQGILEVRDQDDSILEKFSSVDKEVLPEEVTSLISSILSDNVARTPSYGADSALHLRGAGSSAGVADAVPAGCCPASTPRAQSFSR